MVNRATCPVCNSYSSSILYDIQNGDDCRVCGCPNQLLEEYQEILNRKEVYENNVISNEILQENEKLIKENFFLKTKIMKLVEIFGYEFDSHIIVSLQKALKIIHETEIDNDR